MLKLESLNARSSMVHLFVLPIGENFIIEQQVIFVGIHNAHG
jgi:hypothetical protein